MIWTPHVTVATIIEKAHRFLMVEEMIDGNKVLNQPAGHLEDGESLREAIIREVLEETACLFEPEALTGIYRWRVPNKDRTYLRFCFTGVAGDRIPEQKLDQDIIRTRWLTLEELQANPQNLRSPMVLKCIRDYLLGQRIPLSTLHDTI